MKKKISVIVPVYNGQKYISRCIDSILDQKGFSVNDLDIILINDGSKDSSIDVLREYESKYPDIVRVIDQENKGVAKTRNIGIDVSVGKYTIFIDQDDYINTDYCSVFYNEIESSDCDVVSGGYIRPDASGKIRQISSPKSNLEFSKYIVVAAWAKIHRTSFLKDNKIQFFTNKFGEDCVFTIKEISKTNKWKQIDYIGYNWFFNNSSVSNTVQRKLGRQEIDALLILIKTLSELKENQNDRLYGYYMLRVCVHYLLFSGRMVARKDFMSAYQSIKPWINNNMNLSYMLLLNPKGEESSVKLIVLIFSIIHRLRLMGLFVRVYCKG